MLKVDFHIHTGSEQLDRLRYTDKELIDRAAELRFDAISITNHEILTFSEELRIYAEDRGILLIPGSEINIEGKHVLVLNICQDDVDNVKSFKDLEKLKSMKDILVVAPHPYFIMPNCLGRKLEKHIALFDAVEYAFFHTRLINRNRKAEATAGKHNKPMVAFSDTHSIEHFGMTYTLIESEKDFKSIKNAIAKNKVKKVSPEIPLLDFLKIAVLALVKKEF